MYTQNVSPVPQQDIQPTLRVTLDQLRYQIDRYNGLSDGITNSGHRFHNTSTPEEKSKKQEQTASGFISELQLCVEALVNVNDKTELALQKFNSII